MKRFFLVILALLVAVVLLPPAYYALFPPSIPDLPPAGRMIPVADGVSVNALEQGTGPLVVLVHGLPGSAYDWRNLSRALAERGRRVIAYDRVGYGHSNGRPDEDFTLSANGRDLVRLLESEEARDTTVVGWSYGGGTAIRAAILDPSRIGRLVLVGSSGPVDQTEEPPAFVAILFSAPVSGWMALVPPIGLGLQRLMSVQAYSEQPMPDWWLPQLAGNFKEPNTRITNRLEGASYTPGELDPSPIALPILVIHGDDDRLVPLAVGEGLDRRSKNSELVVVPGGSHMLPVTHADLLADRIVAFEAAN